MATTEPAFATDVATARYYESRAAEYDDWYEGRGLFADRDRPGWDEELTALASVIADLPGARTLDVACGTGFLTRYLPGPVVALDRSPAMLGRAALATGAPVLVSDALGLAVRDGAFERVFTGHFYGHLPSVERAGFLAEAGRVADELVVVDSALRPGGEPEQWQERVLNDGSRHRVFKRYLTGSGLAGELGGVAIFEGTWFVAARARCSPPVAGQGPR